MDIKLLQTLLLIHQHGSLMEAARHLNITHGAVSLQMRKLEQQVGLPLVRRVGKRVHLTNAAYQILEPSKEILERVANLSVQAKSDEVCGEIVVGSSPSALNCYLLDVFMSLLSRHPAVSIKVRHGLSHTLYTDLLDGVVDVAFTLEPRFMLPKTVTWEAVVSEPFCLVKSSSVAENDVYKLLSEQPFLYFERQSALGQQVARYLEKIAIHPKICAELPSSEAIVRLVDKGFGVSVLPYIRQLRDEPYNVDWLPLPQTIKPRSLGVMRSRSSPRQRLINVMLEAFRDVYKSSDTASLPHRTGKPLPGAHRVSQAA